MGEDREGLVFQYASAVEMADGGGVAKVAFIDVLSTRIILVLFVAEYVRRWVRELSRGHVRTETLPALDAKTLALPTEQAFSCETGEEWLPKIYSVSRMEVEDH